MTRTFESIEFRQCQLNIFRQSLFNRSTGVDVYPSVTRSLKSLTESSCSGAECKATSCWYDYLPCVWTDWQECELTSQQQVTSAAPMLSVNMVDIVRNSQEARKRRSSSSSSGSSGSCSSCGDSSSSSNSSRSSSCDSSNSCDNSSSISGRDGSCGKFVLEKDSYTSCDSDDSSECSGSSPSNCCRDLNNNISGGEEDSDDVLEVSHDVEKTTHVSMKAAKIIDASADLAKLCCVMRDDIENSAIKCSTHASTSHDFPPVLEKKIREGIRTEPTSCLEDMLIPVPPPSPFDSVVTFLGTGCATPSKHRNGSCILFQLPVPKYFYPYPEKQRVSIVLDAGESCLSQLYQSCAGNMARVHRLLQSIAVIWISHHHADHHCGLPLLLEEIQRMHASCANYSAEKVIVVAPKGVILYQEYCACIAGYDDVVEFIYTNQTCNSATNSNFAYVNRRISLRTKNLLSKLESVNVMHCKDSYGVVLNCCTGEKIVYSGDCRPSQSLISVGRCCDLLIHEGTFDDSMACDAISKQHSTISEALHVGDAMQARHVILTHFSQRYPKKEMEERSTKIVSNIEERKIIIMAHDFMRFSFPSQIEQVRNSLNLCRKLTQFVDNSDALCDDVT